MNMTHSYNLEVSINGGYPSWMVVLAENPIKIMRTRATLWLRKPPFVNVHPHWKKSHLLTGAKRRESREWSIDIHSNYINNHHISIHSHPFPSIPIHSLLSTSVSSWFFSLHMGGFQYINGGYPFNRGFFTMDNPIVMEDDWTSKAWRLGRKRLGGPRRRGLPGGSDHGTFHGARDGGSRAFGKWSDWRMVVP